MNKEVVKSVTMEMEMEMVVETSLVPRPAQLSAAWVQSLHLHECLPGDWMFAFASNPFFNDFYIDFVCIIQMFEN